MNAWQKARQKAAKEAADKAAEEARGEALEILARMEQLQVQHPELSRDREIRRRMGAIVRRGWSA